jgi:pyridoxal phosphate enzyme (YggS family)
MNNFAQKKDVEKSGEKPANARPPAVIPEDRMQMTLEQRLQWLMTRIEAAAQKAGRNPEDIQVLFAAKYVKEEVYEETIRELARLIKGRLLIGENRVQEAEAKFGKLEGLEVEKHMIGHLQSNKVKKAVEIFDSIDSVDSVELAEEINKYAEKAGKVMPIYLEVNFSGEESKHGFEASEVEAAYEKMCRLPNVKVVGIMTMAPHPTGENEKEILACFDAAKALADKLGLIVSMGMTLDFEIAIACGANIVRIGRFMFEKPSTENST